MKSHERVEIKQVPRDVALRLSTQAKQAGFKSRQAYLLEVLTQLSLSELQLEAEQRYKYILKELNEILKINTETLQENRDAMNELVDHLE